MKNRRNMMKKSFSVICLLLLAFYVSGQEETEKKIRYGIKVGTTISSFSSEQPHTNYKPGFIIGGFLSYKLSGNLALQTEPSYFQQGGTLVSIIDPSLLSLPNYPFSNIVKNQRVTFHNIDIPILIKYEKEILSLNVFGLIGPSLALNIHSGSKSSVSARSLDTNLPVYFDYSEEENITSNIEFLQYGVIGGLGFETPIGKNSLIFDIKYRYSLNKTYKGYSYLDVPQVQGDLRSNTFYITLGIGF